MNIYHERCIKTELLHALKKEKAKCTNLYIISVNEKNKTNLHALKFIDSKVTMSMTDCVKDVFQAEIIEKLKRSHIKK